MYSILIKIINHTNHTKMMKYLTFFEEKKKIEVSRKRIRACNNIYPVIKPCISVSFVQGYIKDFQLSLARWKSISARFQTKIIQ